MSWGRIDDKLWFHPKTEEAGIEAMGAWLILYSYSCFIERPNVPKVVALKRVDKRQDLLDKLVEVGFLEDANGDYVFHDWHDYRPAGEIDPDRRRRVAAMGGIARHEKYGTRAPDCDKCKRWKRRCPDHREEAGAEAADKQPTGSRLAPVQHPPEPASHVSTVRNDSLRQDAFPVPVPVPVPIQTERAVEKVEVDLGDTPSWDQQKCWQATASRWKDAPLWKDKAGKADSVDSGFKPFSKKINATNWPSFWQHLGWEVEKRFSDNKAGCPLYSFINNGDWEAVTPPTKVRTVGKYEKPLLHPDA